MVYRGKHIDRGSRVLLQVSCHLVCHSSNEDGDNPVQLTSERHRNLKCDYLMSLFLLQNLQIFQNLTFNFLELLVTRKNGPLTNSSVSEPIGMSNQGARGAHTQISILMSSISAPKVKHSTKNKF